MVELNRNAQAQLTHCENHLTVIPGATHLFEEPGALPAVAAAARDWFAHYLGPAPPGRAAGARSGPSTLAKQPPPSNG